MSSCNLCLHLRMRNDFLLQPSFRNFWLPFNAFFSNIWSNIIFLVLLGFNNWSGGSIKNKDINIIVSSFNWSKTVTLLVLWNAPPRDNMKDCWNYTGQMSLLNDF